MDSAERLEALRIEALCAEGDAGKPGSSILPKPAALDRPGVRFHRHLDVGGQREMSTRRCEHAPYSVR